jgi:branched-chain amino acid transport system permease protein
MGRVTGGDNGILGVWPEKWAASAVAFLLAVARRRRARGRRCCGSSCSRRSALRARDAGFAAAQRGDRHQRQAHPVDGLRDRRHGGGHRRRAVRLSQGQRISRQSRHSLSVDALVMVLLGGVETVSGAVVGAIVYKALNIWLVSQTDLSKLVLGGFIVLIVVAFPKGIVGVLETIRNRRRRRRQSRLLLGLPHRDRRMSIVPILLSVEA